MLPRRTRPLLSRVDLSRRWDVSAGIAASVQAASPLPRARAPGARPRHSLPDVLGIEGVASPERTRALADDGERDALHVPLPDARGVCKALKRKTPPHPATLRRWAQNGDVPALRTSAQWCFRRCDFVRP